MTHCPGNPNFATRKDMLIAWAAIAILFASYIGFALFVITLVPPGS